MIWALLLFTCLGVWGLNLAQADVIFVSGDVSGTWSADTVIVTAEVRIPPGEMLVIEPGRKFKMLAENKLDGRFMASPVVIDNTLILRTKTHLYRIEEKKR